MSAPDEVSASDLAEQTLRRRTVPAARARQVDGPDHDQGRGHDEGHEHALKWPEVLRIALVAVAAAAVWWRVWEPLHAFSLIGIAGLLIGGWPIFREALENLLAKRMTMELSMSIAIIAAAAISEFFTALVITLFVLIAEVLEGINDAPALIEAQVGVAMGSGTDVARESADVVLLGNDLAKFAETLSIARRTRAIIWANFAGTIGVDAVGIGFAAFGFLNPLFAAFIHVASELTFILNSARLLPSRSGGERAITAALLSAGEEVG
jgi:cation transport ATPase